MKVYQKYGLSFELNNNGTAAIIGSDNARGSIVIPRSIDFDSKEYFITVIRENSFKYNGYLNSIDFEEGSQLHTIEKGSFFRSSIQSLTIPSSVEVLQEGWCSNTSYLTDIQISPDNKKYSYADEERKIIIGKSDKNCEVYDILIFACRDIEKVIVPHSIKHISSFSFFQCEKLDSIEIPENSMLLSIGEFAFTWSSIQKLSIPSNFEKFENNWCGYLDHLVEISISPDNKNFSFADEEHKILIGKSTKNCEVYDVLVFACRDIEHARIPKYIKYIESFAFYQCYQLKTFEFEDDSELLLIDEKAFYSASIVRLTIPSKVEELKKGWCNYTGSLIEISISPDNKNFSFADEEHKIVIGKSAKNCEVYDVLVFACRDIEYAIIPRYIKHIDSFAFYECKHLKSVEFERNSQLISIGKRAFSHSSIESISLPETLKTIGKSAFLYCKNLQEVEFPKNSELSLIDKKAFANSSITNILVPSKTKAIKNDAFAWCSTLEKVEFLEDSELELIGEYALSGTSIKSFTIPPNVSQLQKNWCSFTSNLNEILISTRNKNFSYADKDHKLVVFKSDKCSDYYDSLVFACRDINHVVIPSYVRYICSSSFNECKKVKTFEFEENSNLLSIDEFAFTNSSISNISLPRNLNKIGSDAFSYCFKLKALEYLGMNSFNENFCFLCCSELLVISFPNVKEIQIDKGSLSFVESNDFSIFICNYAIVTINN